MMRFQPKSEKDVASAGNWPAGEYPFEIIEATEGESSTGNDMITMKVVITNDDGRTRTIWDYLVGTEGMAYKVRHCAYATGLGEEYERGELHGHDLEGRTGTCKVGVQKDKNKVYPDKN